MPRPHPVVRLAAEVADALGRRVNETHVANLHRREAQILRPFEHGGDAAAHPARLLAFGDELFSAAADLLIARAIVERRGQRADDLVGHVLDVRRDGDA